MSPFAFDVRNDDLSGGVALNSPLDIEHQRGIAFGFDLIADHICGKTGRRILIDVRPKITEDDHILLVMGILVFLVESRVPEVTLVPYFVWTTGATVAAHIR